MINYDKKIITIKIGQGHVHASGQDSNDVVRNLPGVRRELTEGIESLAGWHKGVCKKKIETHRKIVMGSRKAYREYRAKDWTMRWELVGRSLGLRRRYREDH
ncbi:hypothetical protein B296_00033328 [Ensete ventricosum]|uniref:Uncharacterized protein n=1 Tax=Ensete ventricosum TaxID=4639 RepID=A0A427A9J0_ENSVE|nr:hypothetical protein B296_00033328 [Ensete ventricosum]